MIFELGCNLLIAHRRLFKEDQTRFFVGRLVGYEDGLAKVAGYSWSRDPRLGGMHRKEDLRTKIISIASGTLIIYQLPSESDPSMIQIENGHNQELVLTDGNGFHMDLTEKSSV